MGKVYPLFVEDKDDDKKEDDIFKLDGATINISEATGDVILEENKPKKKRKYTKRIDSDKIITDDDKELSMLQSNKSYIQTYEDTNNMLKGSIYQIDTNLKDLQIMNNTVKNSRLKNKYNYISDFGQTMSSLISTKITAIREINNSITHAHDLELKRNKELKLTQTEKNDDKKIMDYYNALISTPRGNYDPFNAPTMAEMSTASPNIIRTPIQPANSGDAGYDNYMNSLSPQQHMMILENNPNIQTVLKYDTETGQRWFDVVDIGNGQSIPNTDKPSQEIADDCLIDIETGVARNTHLGTSYPLSIVNKGLHSVISQY